VGNPQPESAVRLTVVGVLRDFATSEMFGITTSQAALAPLGDRAAPRRPTTTCASRPASTPPRPRGSSSGRSSRTFNRLIQGFMGLGLVVGVAALGVISARAVVERRQQIGILRAIGFRRRMIQASFLVEASFVALTAIVVGTALALVIGRNVVADSSAGSVYGSIPFTVPWLDLAVVFAGVYAAALLATLAPALRASRIYPAQALRYE
jgi:putative ABC transport system permease protein